MIKEEEWQAYLDALGALPAALDAAIESQRVLLRKLEPVRNFVADYKFRERFGRLPIHAAGELAPFFPPQGEPAGDDPEQTEKEAIEAETNSHLHA